MINIVREAMNWDTFYHVIKYFTPVYFEVSLGDAYCNY